MTCATGCQGIALRFQTAAEGVTAVVSDRLPEEPRWTATPSLRAASIGLVEAAVVVELRILIVGLIRGLP